MTTLEFARRKWKQILDDTINEVKADPEYSSMTACDQFLSFYYTLTANLEESRDFILARYDHSSCFQLHTEELRSYRKTFLNYSSEVVSKGRLNGRLPNLVVLNRGYTAFLWAQHLFIARYWLTDESQDREKTDALIEKSINSFFNLLGKGDIQSILDVGKFMIQNPIKLRWQ